MSYHSIKNKNIVNIETFEYKKNRITFWNIKKTSKSYV
jgi:hypothetical protein